MTSPAKSKVLITGASGMIGSVLTPMLVEAGYEVAHLSRSANSKDGTPTFVWSPNEHKMDPKALDGVDYVIHLAGAGIADKNWSEARKKLIIDSRTETAATLLKQVQDLGIRLKGFISASGINYYGSETNDHIHIETDPAGTDFTGECCRVWEEAADAFEPVADRIVKLRVGVVLGHGGGALPRIAKPVKMGFGAALGSGKQYIPWVHIEDVCRMFLFALDQQQMNGVYNAITSDHLTNKGFNQALAKVLKKPLWMPNVPAFALKMVFGEMATLVLNGSRASGEKLEKAGFELKYPTIDKALEQLYST